VGTVLTSPNSVEFLFRLFSMSVDGVGSFSGQQLAQQMQQSNPELVEQLRSQMRGQSSTTSSDNSTANDQSEPGI